MSFCDISFNRKSGVVTDVLNKEGRESALYPQLVSYVQQDPQTVYDSKKEYFNTLIDQGKLVEGKVKKDVGSLFESNPELANAVYESLEFDITQNDKSYYRGQIEKPTIDKDGNLILYGREDELYKRAGLKSKGVSMTDNLETAIEYGNGQLTVAQNLASESYDAEQELERLSENGYYLIQIPKSISNEIVKEAGEIKIIGNKIIIPKGQYKIKQIVDGVEIPITLQQKQKAAPLSPDELALGLYSIAYNSGRSEQEFIDNINTNRNLSVFGVGGQQVFNQTVPVQQVSIEQEQKLKDVAYEYFNIKGYSEYMKDQDRYNIPWKRSYVVEQMTKFGGSDLNREQLKQERKKIEDQLNNVEQKVDGLYQQYINQSGDVNNTNRFKQFVENNQVPVFEEEKELPKETVKKISVPQTTEEFISETMKSYNKQNALYAKRLESVLKQHPVGLEQSNYSGPIEYNAAKNTVLVPTVIDNVFDEQVQKEILNQLMVGAFNQAAKEKLKPITAGKINPKTASRPFVFTKIQMESLKQRYGDKVELKNYFDNVIDFVTGYMTDLELSNWADNRFSPKEMAIEKMAELITTEVFEKPILKSAVEEYLKTAPIRMIYTKEVSNTSIDEIVSEIEEYGVIEGDYKESKIKIKENTADVISIVNEIYQTYGEKISDFIFMNESPDGTLTVTVDRKKIAEYQEEIKNQIKENIAANNKYQIEEIEKRKETDMVDAVSYLDYLSDEDKRLAQVFIERGDFPLQCGI